MKYYLYELSPIDFGWDLLPTFEELQTLINKRTKNDEYWHKYAWEQFSGANWLRMHAEKFAKENGFWDIKIAQGPRILCLPPDKTNGDSFLVALTWKQIPNGITYIVSPVQLNQFGLPEAEFDVKR